METTTPVEVDLVYVFDDGVTVSNKCDPTCAPGSCVMCDWHTAIDEIYKRDISGEN